MTWMTSDFRIFVSVTVRWKKLFEDYFIKILIPLGKICIWMNGEGLTVKSWGMREIMYLTRLFCGMQYDTTMYNNIYK